MNYQDQQVSAIKQLWAAKLLLHARDYAMGIRATSGRIIKDPQNTYASDARIARNWIYSTSYAPASFLWICDLFDLDPESTRLRIEHGWRELIGLDKGKSPATDIFRAKPSAEDDDDL